VQFLKESSTSLVLLFHSIFLLVPLLSHPSLLTPLPAFLTPFLLSLRVTSPGITQLMSDHIIYVCFSKKQTYQSSIRPDTELQHEDWDHLYLQILKILLLFQTVRSKFTTDLLSFLLRLNVETGYSEKDRQNETSNINSELDQVSTYPFLSPQSQLYILILL